MRLEHRISNFAHRTLNADDRVSAPFDVLCSMFDVRSSRFGCGIESRPALSRVPRWRVGLVWVALAFTFTPATAASPEALLAEGVQEYSEALKTQDPALRGERFRRAQRLFQKVADDRNVQNVELFVNLGNAALQGEQIGTAIWAYRRVLAIEPGHRQARQNLEHARTLLPTWVPRPSSSTLLDTFFFWHQTMPRSGRTLLAALVFLIAGAFLSAWVRWRRPWARNVAVLCALVWIALSAISMWTSVRGAADEVVITVPQVIARAADSAGAPARFAQPLPAGTEAHVLERREPWVRIRLANGRDAWVRASSVTAVGS